MHPSKFFEECKIDELIMNVQEREEMKNKLKNIHPRNILGSTVDLFVVKVEMEYETDKGNTRVSEKYTLLPLDTDGYDSLELQAEIMCQSKIDKENMKHIDNQLKNYKVTDVEIITRVTLPIG